MIPLFWWKGSLVYAELGTLMPKSGGEYIYFLETYSKLHPFWGPLLPFTYSWVTVLLLRPATTSIAALAFAEYSILPIMTSAGLCDEAYRYSVIRLTAALAVCKWLFVVCSTFECIPMQLYDRFNNSHQLRQRQNFCTNTEYLHGGEISCYCCYCPSGNLQNVW